MALSNESQPDRDHITDGQFEIGMNNPQLSSANLPVVTDSGNHNYAANSNSQMNLSLSNIVPVHHTNIVVLASDIIPNPQTIRVLDTDIVDLSTGTIDGTDNSYELEFRQNMLIIGMANNNHIADQWDSASAPPQEIDVHVCYNNRKSDISNIAISNINLFIDIQGNAYNTHVLRDFIRCKRAENLFPNIFVHTVNIYRDSFRDSNNLSELDMNRDSNSRICIQQTEDRRWKINEIYVDHYRTLNPYLTDKFRKGFFGNINQLAKIQVLYCQPQNPNKIPVVYLTFTPRMFVNVHRYKLNE